MPLYNNNSPPAAPQAGTMAPLFRLSNANMNSTGDQIFTPLWSFTKYAIRECYAAEPTVSLSNVVGGIYSAPAKGGTALVAASQSWGALKSTDSGATVPITTGANGKILTGTSIYLSLTTPKGSAASLGSITLMGYGA